MFTVYADGALVAKCGTEEEAWELRDTLLDQGAVHVRIPELPTRVFISGFPTEEDGLLDIRG